MNQNQPPSEVLTVNEIAGYLRVSETTVWRWCNSGKLPAFRIGRSWRIRRTDLEQHIQQSVSELELASNNTF
jgi:excisionase family DNA binding protein